MRAERSSRSALPAEQQAELYEHSWLPELYHILRGDEAMPITRLVRGARYAARIWLLPRALAANSIPRQPAEFRADHPFVVAIRDVQTGVIMFLGRVAKP